MPAPKKKIILFKHYGGRLGNQLWPAAALYAYCLEKGYEFRNYCFFNYAADFSIPVHNWLIYLLFYSPLTKISFRKFSPLRHWLYPKYVSYIKKKYGPKIIDDTKEVDAWKPFYLPPSPIINPEQQAAIAMGESSPDTTTYVSGWMYRNPVGMEKYRSQIIKYFMPRPHIRTKVTSVLSQPRSQYKRIVGVHLRLGDYRYVEDKVFFFEPQVVRGMLDEYVTFSGLSKQDICFVICSDETLDAEIFKGLQVIAPYGTPTEDLFTLAGTDLIIGSDSTFGPFAAYYGNIPFIVFERNGIDWEYYRDKKTFFIPNKPNRVFY